MYLRRITKGRDGRVRLIFRDGYDDEYEFTCLESEFIERFLRVFDFRYSIGRGFVDIEYTSEGTVSRIKFEDEFERAVEHVT